jgi:putative N-acetylmannosamine-6-phosphate epimerase
VIGILKKEKEDNRVEQIQTSSKVKSLITNNAFWIVQKATKQSKTGIFILYGVAEVLVFNDSRRSELN